MSMTLMAQAMKIKTGNPLRKLVLIKLADNASDQGECWPSIPHIASECEISERSVQKHIQYLAENKYLWIESRKSESGLNRSNVYHLTLDRAIQCSGANAAPGGGAGDSPGGAGDSPGGAGDSPGGGAGDSPRSSHFFESISESVIEPKSIDASADANAPARQVKQEYSDEFEAAWREYPKRAGGNSKRAAWKAWSARIRQGVSVADMLAGVQRYAAFVRAERKERTVYVKQAATFFGPDGHFEDSWALPVVNASAISQPDKTVPDGFVG